MFFNFWAFRRWLYGLVLETSVRKFESCRPDQFFQFNFLRRRSPTARGTGLRNQVMWVQISPSVLIFHVEVAEWWDAQSYQPGFVRTRLVRVKIPPSTPILFSGWWCNLDSIEVLQTSRKGLNPFQSTKFYYARAAQLGRGDGFKNRLRASSNLAASICHLF